MQSIEEIRKNAPIGATHYIEINSVFYYYKYSKGFLYFFNEVDWSITYRKMHRLKPL